jgi:uncharacterized membrane protein
MKAAKEDPGQDAYVERTVTIAREPEELYQFWRNFENLPRVMEHIVSIQVLDATRSRWEVKAPAGTVSWISEVQEDLPNERISWRSAEGSEVQNAGAVEFRRAPGNRGTEVKVRLRYHAPGGVVGAALAKLKGEEPSQQIREDLRHLKQVMEAGEIPTTVGQPEGKR